MVFKMFSFMNTKLTVGRKRAVTCIVYTYIGQWHRVIHRFQEYEDWIFKFLHGLEKEDCEHLKTVHWSLVMGGVSGMCIARVENCKCALRQWFLRNQCFDAPPYREFKEIQKCLAASSFKWNEIFWTQCTLLLLAVSGYIICKVPIIPLCRK